MIDEQDEVIRIHERMGGSFADENFLCFSNYLFHLSE